MRITCTVHTHTHILFDLKAVSVFVWALHWQTTPYIYQCFVSFLLFILLYKIHCCTNNASGKSREGVAKECCIFSYYVFSMWLHICNRILEILLFECAAPMILEWWWCSIFFSSAISIDHFSDKFSQMEHFIFHHLREHIIVPMSMRIFIDVRLRMQPAQS